MVVGFEALGKVLGFWGFGFTALELWVQGFGGLEFIRLWTLVYAGRTRKSVSPKLLPSSEDPKP